MTQLISISDLEKKDFVVVLPMSSEEPDSSFIFFKSIVDDFGEIIIFKIIHKHGESFLYMLGYNMPDDKIGFSRTGTS